jgi:peptidyl-prolyl cis-trans isomerase D
MAGNTEKYLSINSINDDGKFDENSVKILYSLPINSYTLVNDEKNEIYLVKLISSKKNSFSKTDKDYLTFINNESTNTRKSILQSYDQLLNSKYQVQLNQKTIDRVKNYFK